MKLPVMDPATVPEKRGSGYPEPFRSRMGERVKRRLGDACGLTKFGVNLVTLGPGAQSALRHWHLDDSSSMCSRRVVLVTNRATRCCEQRMAAGYPAGKKDAHHFINRSGKTTTYLEIGNRTEGDNAFYPDDDLMWGEDENGTFAAHKDGRRY